MSGMECIGIALMAFAVGAYFGAWLVERAFVKIIPDAMKHDGKEGGAE